MLEHAVRFLGLLCVGLAAGTALCVLFVERTWAGSGQFYTEHMQLMIRALTVPAPALGGIGLVATSMDAFLLYRHGVGAPFWFGVAAVLLNLLALALTRLGHFPINDQIMSWKASSPPADWARVQARWFALHLARTCAALGSFVMLLLGNALQQVLRAAGG